MTDYPEMLLPVYVKRQFVIDHPKCIFVYSFDVAGKSFFGQANELHGEPNAFPVPVRWKGCKTSGFFSDASLHEICNLIDIAIQSIPKQFGPIIPLPKIGLGASRMKEFAPRCYVYLMQELNKIKYPNIRTDYVKTY